MAKEIEIKFEVNDENEMLRRLNLAGARKTSEGLEHNEVFDNGEIRRRGMLLRLRKFCGKNTMTFKTSIRKSGFKEAEETEVEVDDFVKAKEILSKLGYEVFWIYEKESMKFVLGDAMISLDRLPFATFIEIEGPPNAIGQAITRLGLDPKKGVTETYFEIYEEHCRERGIPEMENLIFWKKSRNG